MARPGCSQRATTSFSGVASADRGLGRRSERVRVAPTAPTWTGRRAIRRLGCRTARREPSSSGLPSLRPNRGACRLFMALQAKVNQSQTDHHRNAMGRKVPVRVPSLPRPRDASREPNIGCKGLAACAGVGSPGLVRQGCQFAVCGAWEVGIGRRATKSQPSSIRCATADGMLRPVSAGLPGVAGTGFDTAPAMTNICDRPTCGAVVFVVG